MQSVPVLPLDLQCFREYSMMYNVQDIIVQASTVVLKYIAKYSALPYLEALLCPNPVSLQLLLWLSLDNPTMAHVEATVYVSGLR